MPPTDIARRRFRAQRLAGAGLGSPAEVVAWMGAMQAQDQLGTLWAVGARLRRGTEAGVERAIADRSIVRTWLLRGTLHLVAAADLRWLLALVGPGVLARLARRLRELELDEATFARSRALLGSALARAGALTREEAYGVLEAGRVSTSGQRGVHVLMRLALEGLICFGARRGKQPTLVLLEAWAPPAPVLAREAALAELARRYFTGHGPATLADFRWWSGLGAAEAREAVALARPGLEEEHLGGEPAWSGPAPGSSSGGAEVRLLPGFDEYFIGYRDRSAIIDAAHLGKVNPGANGQLSPTLVVGGRIAGTWRRTLARGGVTVSIHPFARLGEATRRAVARESERYARFLGVELSDRLDN